MKKSVLRQTLVLTIISAICLTIGCTATTRTISTEDELHYDEAYDFSDKKKIVDALVEPLLTESPLAGVRNQPILIVYGIANETSEHINTGAIADDIREALWKSGKFRFVSKTQRENIARELGYQHGGAVAPGMRIQKARQIGAAYILSGTLRSIEKEEPKQIRLTKKSLRYYSLHLEITQVQTGETQWIDKVELAREASKPIIGW